MSAGAALLLALCVLGVAFADDYEPNEVNIGVVCDAGSFPETNWCSTVRGRCFGNKHKFLQCSTDDADNGAVRLPDNWFGTVPFQTAFMFDANDDGELDLFIPALSDASLIRYYPRASSVPDAFPTEINATEPSHPMHGLLDNKDWTEMRVTVIDWDSDGDDDLMATGLTQAVSGSGDDVHEFVIWERAADGTLSEIPHPLSEELAAGGEIWCNPWDWVSDNNLPPLCSMEPADWDGDGDVDILLAISRGGRHFTIEYWERLDANTLVQRLGNDNPFYRVDIKLQFPGFGVTYYYIEGHYVVPAVVRAVDLDRDGDMDLVLESQGPPYIQYFERMENGGLVQRMGDSYPFDINPESAILNDWFYYGAMFFADIDHDGDSDFLISQWQGMWGAGDDRMGMWVYYHSNDVTATELAGAQQLRSPFTSWAYPSFEAGLVYSLSFADFDNDGDVDAFASIGMQIDYLEMGNDGLYTWNISVADRVCQDPAIGCCAPRTKAVDWDNDGFIDIFVLSAASSDNIVGMGPGGAAESCGDGQAYLWLYSNDGRGTLTYNASWAPPPGLDLDSQELVDGPFLQIDIVDWDGDELLDFFLGTKVYLQQADGSFEQDLASGGPGEALRQVHAYPSCAWHGLHVVDIDNDDDLDITWGMDILRNEGGSWTLLNFSDTANTPREFNTFINMGVDHACGRTAVGPFPLSVVDIDGDSDLDVVMLYHPGGTSSSLPSVWVSGDCTLESACSGGQCDHGVCTCLSGHELSDCSLCAENSYTPYNSLDDFFQFFLTLGAMHECLACPTSGGSVCAQQGHCWDDKLAQESALATGSTMFQSQLKVGTGECICNEGFSGDSCSVGECAAGSGYILNDTDPTDPTYICQVCEEGYFKPAPGNEKCEACNAQKTSTADRTQCVCRGTTVRLGADQCHDCPEGAECHSGAVQFALSGFWIIDGSDDNEPPSQCPYGTASCKERNECIHGFAGLACFECQDGFVLVAGSCVECAGNTSVGFAFVLLTFLAFAVFFPLFLGRAALFRWWSGSSKVHPEEEEALPEGAPQEAVPDDLKKQIEDGAEMKNGVPRSRGKRKKISLSGMRLCIPNVDGLKRSLSIKFRMVILTSQLLSGWVSSFYLAFPWILEFDAPSIFRGWAIPFANIGSLFSLSLGAIPGPSASIRCTIDTEGELVLYMLAVPCLFGIMLASAKLVAFLTRHESAGDGLFRSLTGPLYFWLTYFAYATLATKIVSNLPVRGAAFDCTFEAQAGCRLREDYRIHYDEDPYQSIMLPLSVAGVFVYLVGIPASYVAIMWRDLAVINPKRLDGEADADFQERRDNLCLERASAKAFGSLYKHLRPECWHFEVINIFRQLLMNGILLLLGSSATVHIYLSFLVVFAHMLAVGYFKPYANKKDTRTMVMCSSAILVLFVTQLAVLPKASTPGQDKRALELEATVLGATVATVFILLFIFTAVAVADDARSAVPQGAALVAQIRQEAMEQLRKVAEPALAKQGITWAAAEKALADLGCSPQALRGFTLDPAGLVRVLMPMVKMSLLSKLQPQLEPQLDKQGITWASFEMLLMQVSLEQLQEALVDPAALLRISGPLMRDALVHKLQPVAEPYCEQYCISWESVEAVLKTATMEELQRALVDPTALLSLASPVIREACVHKLQPLSEPFCEQHGISWESVEKALLNASMEDLQDALFDPDVLLELTAPIFREALVNKLRPKAEPCLAKYGLTWEIVEPAFLEAGPEDLQMALANPGEFIRVLCTSDGGKTLSTVLLEDV